MPLKSSHTTPIVADWHIYIHALISTKALVITKALVATKPIEICIPKRFLCVALVFL